MNKYTRALFCVPFGILKTAVIKVFHISSFRGPFLCEFSLNTEITLDRGGKLHIGNKFRMRDGAKIRVRKNAVCKIGINVSLNSNCVITCRDSIIVGDNVQFSPNVLVYDHDHDFRVENGISEGKYRCAPIIIGNNVWIGANTVVLRGTRIGDNCVIAAGSVVKGNIPANSVFVQKRETEIRNIE